MRHAAWGILASGLLLWGCSPAPSIVPPGGGSTVQPGSLQKPDGATPAPFELRRVKPQEIKARMDQGESIVLADVRGKGSYDLLHIAGAVSMPASDYQVWGPALDKERTVVFY